jgi:hypothetical protein
VFKTISYNKNKLTEDDIKIIILANYLKLKNYLFYSKAIEVRISKQSKTGDEPDLDILYGFEYRSYEQSFMRDLL